MLAQWVKCGALALTERLPLTFRAQSPVALRLPLVQNRAGLVDIVTLLPAGCRSTGSPAAQTRPLPLRLRPRCPPAVRSSLRSWQSPGLDGRKSSPARPFSSGPRPPESVRRTRSLLSPGTHWSEISFRPLSSETLAGSHTVAEERCAPTSSSSRSVLTCRPAW